MNIVSYLHIKNIIDVRYGYYVILYYLVLSMNCRTLYSIIMCMFNSKVLCRLGRHLLSFISLSC